MADPLNMPLDAVIAASKKPRVAKKQRVPVEASGTGGRMKQKANVRSAPYSVTRKNTRHRAEGSWGHDLYGSSTVVQPYDVTALEEAPISYSAPEPTASSLPPLTTGTKIMITNLDPSIAVEDVHELCSSIGPLKGPITFHYNKEAGSIAEVVFAKRQHALNAISEFNGRQLDDRVMKVHMLTSNAAPTIADVPVVRKPALVQPYAGGVPGVVHGEHGEPSFRVTLGDAAVVRGGGRRNVEIRREVSIRGGARGGRGGTRGGRGGRGGAATATAGKRPKPKSADELDSGLDAYKSGVAAGATTEAGAGKGKKKREGKTTKSAEDLDAELGAYKSKAVAAVE